MSTKNHNKELIVRIEQVTSLKIEKEYTCCILVIASFKCQINSSGDCVYEFVFANSEVRYCTDIWQDFTKPHIFVMTTDPLGDLYPTEINKYTNAEVSLI